MEKLYYLVDKNGKNVIMDQYYSSLSYEDEYRTTTDTLEVAQGWIDWAIKHNNIDVRVEQPISIVELTISSKKLLKKNQGG